MIIIDCEVYKNYFLLAAKHVQSGKVIRFESHNDSPIDLSAVRAVLNNNTTISFNGNNYDLPILYAACTGYTNAQLKALSDKIIKSNLPAWKIAEAYDIQIPKRWDHIDLIEVAAGRSSLKIYGGRLGCQKMQDLPIEPSATISTKDAKTLSDYCGNDLDVTELLYKELTPQIALRVKMSEQYGMDLRSKSDSQIAETIIKSEYKKRTGKTPKKPKNTPDSFRYKNPKIISFESDYLKDIFKRILSTDFEMGANGSVTIPAWLKDERIKIGDAEYQMGIGGLHSCEKKQFLKVGEGILCDLDVASYYPNIILQQQLAPSTMGKPFLDVYQSIVNRRMAAKKAGDDVTAYTLKIAANGSFGKLGSKYSFLYSPELLIQTTITGQLALLMLIEKMELLGVKIKSANTDGIVCQLPKDLESEMENAAFDWMLDTSYELERTNYKALASRDVNNYIAVKPDGSAKGKGIFTATGISKNPNNPIVFAAVARCVAEGVAPEITIRACTDVLQFCTVRKVTGGANWRGNYLGKAIRFYYSTDVKTDESIHYVKNNNRVPMSAGAIPMMDLPATFPTNIDYKIYIDEAEKLLCEIGYA